MQKQKDPNKAHQIKLDVIVKALKWLEMDMDVDEVTFLVVLKIIFNIFSKVNMFVALSKLSITDFAFSKVIYLYACKVFFI